jgi:hypothetical protein
MTDLRDAAQQALNSLRGYRRELGCQQPCDAERALEAALKQPEQEPVAWMDPNRGEVCRAHWLESHAPERDVDRFSCPLYTHPPRREWRRLTEEEIHDCFQQRHRDKAVERRMITRAIEAALKERNV